MQEKLRGEVMAVVGGEETVTPAHINSMPYLRHCIKETQRQVLYTLGSNLQPPDSFKTAQPALKPSDYSFYRINI